MDAKMSKPWLRSEFEHPNLLEWVLSNRRYIVAAVLTLAKGWFAAGCPQGDIPYLGMFEEWTRVIGGILSFSGVTGFLSNLNTFYESADEDENQWETFLLILHEHFKDQANPIKQISEHLRSDQDILEILPNEIEIPRDDNEASITKFNQNLGKAFSSRLGTRFGDSHVYVEEYGKDSHTKANLWKFSRGVAGFAV
jgi:hypothetical protein